MKQKEKPSGRSRIGGTTMARESVRSVEGMGDGVTGHGKTRKKKVGSSSCGSELLNAGAGWLQARSLIPSQAQNSAHSYYTVLRTQHGDAVLDALKVPGLPRNERWMPGKEPPKVGTRMDTTADCCTSIYLLD